MHGAYLHSQERYHEMVHKENYTLFINLFNIFGSSGYMAPNSMAIGQ
jgi:hypothetical protein